MWSGIWGLQVPQKVKHLLWRASHNSLPTLCNLRRRNVVQVAVCPRCKSGEEDTLHALWYCPSLFEVWFDDAEIKKALRYRFQEFSDLWGMVLLLRERIDLNLLAICFWMIWTKRNSDRTGEPFVELNMIQTKAKLLLHDFCTAQQPKNPSQVVESRVVRWIPPIPPSLKINFDGACFKESGTAGLGVVVRDYAGSVLGALSQRIQLPSSAIIVELLACRRAMLFAKELRITHCTFEGDAEVVLKAIGRQDSSHPEYGHVISDVLSLATDFQFCSFSFVKRIGNVVAHYLARSSKSGNELQVWFNSIPENIAPLVDRDSL